MAARKQFWWHVASGGWASGDPTTAGILNVGRDIVLVLVDSEEPTGEEPVVPEQDDFVVERIIGQWKLTGAQPAGTNLYVHERVYVVDSEPGSLALRDIANRREADTSFLYHQVTAWDAGWNADVWGNWASSGLVTDRVGTYRNGGPYFRDIRVGRKVLEGHALVYHLQLEGVAIPTDGNFSAQFWMRTLLRKA